MERALRLHLEERQFEARLSTPKFGLQVHKGGVSADADGNLVTATMTDALGNIVFSDRPADHVDVGGYTISTLSAETAKPGNYSLTWTFVLDGEAQTYVTYIEVGYTTPAYDALSVGFQGIIESVWL